MSYVTTVVIFAEYVGDDLGKRLAEGYEQRDGRRVNFADLTAYDDRGEHSPAYMWAGSKFAEADVFGGAFNHLSVDEMLEWLRGLPWARRAAVVWESNGDTGVQVEMVGGKGSSHG